MSFISKLFGKDEQHKAERVVSGTKDTIKVTVGITSAMNSGRIEYDEGTPYNPAHYHVKVKKNGNS